MPQQDNTLPDIMYFSRRFFEVSQRGMNIALRGLPKAHFPFLTRLHYLIEHSGQDGGIYVSQLNKELLRPAPAISRDLRALEQEGLIERSADAADRRKTLVRITPEGDRRRVMCEQALRRYTNAVLGEIPKERIAQLLAFQAEYEQAVNKMAESWPQLPTPVNKTNTGEATHD